MPETTPPRPPVSGVGANIVRMLTNNVGILGLNFVATVLLSRWLLPEGKGVYALVVLIPLTLARIGSLGLPSALTHFTGKDDRRASALLTGATAIALFAGLGCAGAFLLLERAHPLSLFANAPAAAKALAVCAVPLVLWVQFASGILLGLDRQAAFRAVRLTEAVALLAGVVALVVFRDGALYAALAAWLFAQAAATVAGAWALWRAGVRPGAWDSGLLGACLRYGGAAWIGAVASYLLLRVDMYLVNAFLGAEAVGHYSVAVALYGMLFTLPISASVAVLPRVTRAEGPEARQLAALASRVTTGACVGAALVTAALTPFVVPWVFGVAYRPAVAPLLILLPVFLLFGSGAVVHAALQGMGHIRPYAYANALGLLLNIGLNLALIPRWGLRGAAAASTAAYLVMAAIQIATYASRASVPLTDLLFIKAADWSLLMEAYRRRGGRRYPDAPAVSTPVAPS